jgi:hypothetical protein
MSVCLHVGQASQESGGCSTYDINGTRCGGYTGQPTTAEPVITDVTRTCSFQPSDMLAFSGPITHLEMANSTPYRIPG